MNAPHHSELAIELYRDMFEKAYQSGSKLRDRVQEKSDVEALVEHMPVIGVADTTKRAANAEVILANLANARPTVMLEPWEAFDLIDKQSKAVTNVDDMRAYGETLGMGVSRQFDEPILQALHTWDPKAYIRPDMTQTTYGTVGTTYANSTGGTHVIKAATEGEITAEDIAKMKEALLAEDFDVDAQDVTFVYDYAKWSELATDEILANFDYLQQGSGKDNVTATSRFGMIYGAKPIGIGSRGRRAGHGAFPRKNVAYMFVRNAVGLCVGTTENTGVFDWIPMRRGWLVGGEANAGATRIQNAGIVILVYGDA